MTPRDDHPTLVFGHANGFPGGTYRVLFDRWRAAGFEVHAFDRLGHDPQHPVRSNWRPTRDEFIAFVEQVAPGRRVHLVGHSLGGFVALLTACARPASAASVVMLDSPVLAGWRAHSVQVAKATRLIRRVSPGRVSQRRRDHWASAEEALRHFASKHVFARWDERLLADYVACGVEPDPARGGVRLRFDREIETRFYNTLVTDLGGVLHRHPPQCPVGFVGGTRSAEVRQVGMEATRAVTRGRIEWMDGTHLFPMERPDETADAVLRLIDSAGVG